MRNIVKISFMAPTGSGKSTAANFVLNKFDNVVLLKLADPLYFLQKKFYEFLNLEIGEKTQDGELLQFLGYKIEKELPGFLAMEFYKKIGDINDQCTIIVNDDCRPHNYQYLKDWGFIFIRIIGKTWIRNDYRTVDPDHIVESGFDEIDYDYYLSNYGDIQEFQNNTIELIKGILDVE